MSGRLEATGYSRFTRTFWAQCPHGCGEKVTNLESSSAAFRWSTDHACALTVPAPPEPPVLTAPPERPAAQLVGDVRSA